MTPTDDEIRIGLAEFEGFNLEWTGHMAPGLTPMTLVKLTEPCGQVWGAFVKPDTLSKTAWNEFKSWVPDYLTDLNAIHRLEEKLSDEQRVNYAKQLELEIEPSGNDDYEWIDYHGVFQMLHAPARTRALALWEVVK